MDIVLPPFCCDEDDSDPLDEKWYKTATFTASALFMGEGRVFEADGNSSDDDPRVSAGLVPPGGFDFPFPGDFRGFVNRDGIRLDPSPEVTKVLIAQYECPAERLSSFPGVAGRSHIVDTHDTVVVYMSRLLLSHWATLRASPGNRMPFMGIVKPEAFTFGAISHMVDECARWPNIWHKDPALFREDLVRWGLIGADLYDSPKWHELFNNCSVETPLVWPSLVSLACLWKRVYASHMLLVQSFQSWRTFLVNLPNLAAHALRQPQDLLETIYSPQFGDNMRELLLGLWTAYHPRSDRAIIDSSDTSCRVRIDPAFAKSLKESPLYLDARTVYDACIYGLNPEAVRAFLNVTTRAARNTLVLETRKQLYEPEPEEDGTPREPSLFRVEDTLIKEAERDYALALEAAQESKTFLLQPTVHLMR